MAANDDEVFMEVIDIDYDEVMPYEELEKYNNFKIEIRWFRYSIDDFDQMEDTLI